MVKWPLHEYVIRTVHIVVMWIEFMCCVGKVNVECNRRFSSSTRSLYSSLDMKDDCKCRKTAASHEFNTSEANVLGEMTTIPSFLDKSNQVL